MKAERNSKGAFISHDGLKVFFNNDGTLRVTKRVNSVVYNQWRAMV